LGNFGRCTRSGAASRLESLDVFEFQDGGVYPGNPDARMSSAIRFLVLAGVNVPYRLVGTTIDGLISFNSYIAFESGARQKTRAGERAPRRETLAGSLVAGATARGMPVAWFSDVRVQSAVGL
jgi:hypothetical protein